MIDLNKVRNYYVACGYIVCGWKLMAWQLL